MCYHEKSIEVVTFCRTFAYHGSATTNGDRHATPISREPLEALKTCPFYYNLLPHHYANVINFINSCLDQYNDKTRIRRICSQNKRITCLFLVHRLLHFSGYSLFRPD